MVSVLIPFWSESAFAIADSGVGLGTVYRRPVIAVMLLFLSFSAASSGACLPAFPTKLLAEETCGPSKIGSRAPTLLARRRKQEAKPRCRRRRWRQPQASEKGDPPKSGAVANRKSGATLAAAVPPTHTHYYLFDVFFLLFSPGSLLPRLQYLKFHLFEEKLAQSMVKTGWWEWSSTGR